MSQELEGTLTNSANLTGTFGSEGGGGTSNYNDLINKPSINSVTLQGNKTASQLGFANVATSGSYDDLSNKPTIPAAQVNSDWNAVSGVAEILNKPTIPAAQVNSDWNASSGVAEILNKPILSAVATSGDYDDLTNKPSIPAAQVNSDWNASSGVAEILNKPTVYANAAELPVSSTDPTDTKSYIDTGLSGKANTGDIPTVSDFIKTDTTGSITTDGTGFYSVTKTGSFVILSAWSPQTDIIIIPFSATGSTASGYYKWWFKVCGANLTPKTNFNVTIYYSYVVL